MGCFDLQDPSQKVIKRTSWKVLGLAYMKLETSGCWVETWTGAHITTT